RLGNLVYANGCLAIAGAEKLAVYLAPGKQRAKREAEARAQPQSPTARLRLALADAGAGPNQQARGNLRLAEQLAAAQAMSLEPARSTRHELLLDAAAKAALKHAWDEAARFLDTASAAEFLPAQRAQAQVRLARIWNDAADWPRAVSA